MSYTKGGTWFACTCCGYRKRVKHGLGKFLHGQRRAHKRGIEAANG